MNTDDFAIFIANPLFKELNQEQIRKIYSISRPVAGEAGTVLLEEGHQTSDFYLILEGTVDIIKRGKNHESHLIATLSAGDVVGEIGLIDTGLISAEVRIASPTRLRAIPMKELRLLIQEDKELHEFIFEVAKHMSRKLRVTNEQVLRTLDLLVEESRTRQFMGTFLIYLITGLCVFTFVAPWLSIESQRLKIESYVTMSVTLTILLVCLFFIKRSHLPFSDFGITLMNWKRSVYEGIVYTIPILLIIAIIKLSLMNGTSLYENLPFFQMNRKFHSTSLIGFDFWLISIGLYWLVVPIQELINRGCLQGCLEVVLIGKHKTIASIIISNLIFSTGHILISPYFSLLVFVPGLYMGWLFYRTKNLIGVSIAHGLIGTWGAWIIGF